MSAPTLVIPVKPLTAGKSRLDGVLEPAERASLNRRFLDHILTVSTEYPGAAQTIIVSRDAEVLDAARDRGMTALTEPGKVGLNGALDLGFAAATSDGPRDVLIVHADLPNLSADDLRALCEAPVALAPDTNGTGTNGMFLAAPHRIPFRFGLDSFRKHIEAARQLGLEPHIVRRPGLAFDVDTSDDLDRISRGSPP